MARIFARRKPAPTLTAAVAPVADPMQSFRASLSKAADWQTQGWDMYRQVGELRFLCSWLAAALSRCRLIASEIDPTTGTPTGTTENEQVAQVVRDIAGGPAGQARMLSRWATMYTVPGEVFIAALSRTIARLDVEEWHMLSRAEIKKTGSGLTLTLEDGTKHEFEPGRDVLFRVWTPDPQNSQDADSPVRSALEPLTEIVESSATVRNAMRSRLIGGKMLFVPSQMSLPKTSPAPTADPVDPDAPNLPVPPVMEQAKPQDLQDMLFDVATAATDDPDSAAAHLPIIIGADGEQIGNVKLVEIGQDVSEQALKTREAAIRRFALASDMPPEILLGIASANHWGGGVIQEEAHRHAIRPLEELCDALTVSLLRPKLEQLGLDPDAYVVWYDASALVQDPDKKQEALDAHDRGAITSAALRRHLGFADEDGYDLNTLAGWQQAAADKAAANPELLPLLAPLISAALPQITPPAGETVEVVEGVRAT